ncbi:nucleotidyltransferase domain-containing protein [Metabacillus halosaccharovorans]|uniref:nucleotidyltransferase domain-containing protein n=1 Tax=Metabacillus halosaccharovorans TaxID=930124 RepID=UPI00403DEAEF
MASFFTCFKSLTTYMVYIFGSTLKGTSNKYSDIDIAYLSDQEINEYENFMLAQDLAGKINFDVDLIDFKKSFNSISGSSN